jgi:arylsulfatase A-like enzyme
VKKLAVLIALAACGDSGPTRSTGPGPGPGPGSDSVPVPVPVPVPDPVSLSDSPSIDLAANAVRWHLRDAGLVIPVATEGLRKYALEYRSPWGDVRTIDGQPGRALAGKKATLTIPWEAAGPVRVAVVARGTGTLAVAGFGKATLDGTWQHIALDGTLAAGEVSLTLSAPKGTLVQYVEVMPETIEGGCPRDGAPVLTPAPRPGALGGASRMSLLLEIPRDAYLVTTPQGGGDARITVTSADGATETLLDGPAPDGARQQWSLAAFADQLVRLEIENPQCDVVWDAPRIAVAARPAPAARTPAQHLILVVVDTLRADRLAAYRDTRVKTPRLTAAVKDRGAVFLRNQSMAPSSPPSHATIHTGQIPRVHGAAGDTGDVHAGAPVLAAILGDAGFHTAYIGNNDFAMGRLRKVAGWDVAKTMIYEQGAGKDCAPIVEEVLAIVKEVRAAGQRSFVTMLPIEPHVPYRYHEGITEAYYPGPYDKPLGKRATSAHLSKMRKVPTSSPRWDHLRGLYDGEVEYFDGCYGALEDGLAALGATGDTAIVLTSDHGEGLGERGGNTGHAYGLHGELIDVPLIVIGGGVAAGAVDVATSNADIAPTVLALLGLPADERMQGANLLEPSLHRVIASEYGRSYALRGGRWRMVVDYDGTATLHDVVADPEEVTDVSAAQPMARRWLRDAAGLYLAHRVAWRAATWGSLGDLAATSPLAPGAR